MSSGYAIAAILPSVTTGTIFSTRRADKASQAVAQNNPLVGIMNLDIAGGQITNAAKGVANISRGYTNSVATGITSAEESIKALAASDKVVGGIGKVLNFTANNINPLICAASGVKVLTSDDKPREFVHEGLALSTMFASEALAKKVLGMPKSANFDANKMFIEAENLYEMVDGKKVLKAKAGEFNIVNNKTVYYSKKGLIKENPFMDKQINAFKDYCDTKKILNNKMSLKFLPSVLKGLAFVSASIIGYKIGATVADSLLGEPKQKEKKV